MSQRYFLPQSPAGTTACLDGDEARHVARVMRARPGDQIAVFDGAGHSWPAVITRIERGQIDLELGPMATEPEPPCRLTVAVALPKGDRQKWLIEKLTELGVASLVPLTTTRSVAQPTTAANERLRRGVIEACKQCGRSRLLEIKAACRFTDWLAEPHPGTRLLADPAGRPLLPAIRPVPRDVLIAIGPEGGFTPEEVTAAEQAGFTRVSIGSSILRIETAALAVAAIIGQHAG